MSHARVADGKQGIFLCDLSKIIRFLNICETKLAPTVVFSATCPRKVS
jgi:hypothetical protein